MRSVSHTHLDSERQAKELLVKLAQYKPLAKIEELEEQNYNMIDAVSYTHLDVYKRQATMHTGEGRSDYAGV